LRYRVGRFLTRNKLPVAGAAMFLVTITAGAVIVEKQRRVAVAENARAEKHIKSIRKLSTSLMFDVDDKLREVQGATAARAALAANTSRYLAELAKEVGNDREFRLELARAFSRLGDIQGRVNSQNVGKFSDALASYDQSILLLDKAAETPLPDKLARGSLETLTYALKEKSRVLNLLDRVNEAVDASTMGLGAATQLANMPNATAQQKLLKASLMVEAGRHRARQQQQPQIRKQAIIDAISWVRTLDFEQMDSDSGIKKYEPSDTLAWLHSELGHMLRREPAEESKRQAIEMYRFALAIREARSAAEPENTSSRRSIAAHFIAIAEAQRDLRQFPDALSLYEKAVEIVRELLVKDASNQQLRADLVEALLGLASIRLELGQDQGVLSAVLEARNNFEKLPAEMRTTQVKQKTLERLAQMEAQARSSIAARSSALKAQPR
jgi:eukaryotic-like serine/threonine-protein kinase